MALITDSVDNTFSKSIMLTHKDVIFQVSVDSETEELLQQDDKRRKEYAKHIYETCLAEEPPEPEKIELFSETSTLYPEDVAGCSSNSLQSSHGFLMDSFSWTPKNTLLLVRTRLAMEEDFCNPRNRKSKLWEKISEVLEKNGNSISADMCDTKWRNLLQTYRKIKEKGLKGQITWAFFGLIDQVLGKKYSKAPPKIVLASSMDVPDSSSDSNPEPQIKKKKMKEKPLEGPDWFMSMIRKLDARDARIDAWERKKSIAENERWNKIFSKLEATKKLEEEKLEALKRLESALTICLERNTS